MQLVVIACLAAGAFAAPQQVDPRYQDYERQGPDHRHYAILRDERVDHGDGNFRYEFETENGIHVGAIGTPGSKGQSNIEGFYRFPLDDGTIKEVTYVADEFGYRPESSVIHRSRPLPNKAIEQIRASEEQSQQDDV